MGGPSCLSQQMQLFSFGEAGHIHPQSHHQSTRVDWTRSEATCTETELFSDFAYLEAHAGMPRTYSSHRTKSPLILALELCSFRTIGMSSGLSMEIK